MGTGVGEADYCLPVHVQAQTLEPEGRMDNRPAGRIIMAKSIRVPPTGGLCVRA